MIPEAKGAFIIYKNIVKCNNVNLKYNIKIKNIFDFKFSKNIVKCEPEI